MSNNKGFIERLSEYKDNLKSAINMRNFEMGMIQNDLFYNFLFELYKSTHGRYLKDTYVGYLENVAYHGILIQERDFWRVLIILQLFF